MPRLRVAVIGAGIGGLCAALRLASSGLDVIVLDKGPAPGGKMRQINGVDAGPTVLTMRHVFDDLFSSAGLCLQDHVSLHRQEVLARHWWPGTGPLDLFSDRAQSADAIGRFFDARAQREFDAFCKRAELLFDGFRQPVMEAPTLSMAALTSHVARNPRLISPMAPLSTLSGLLDKSFSDPRLRQLFGRYATYVGGSPYRAPALLSLIWRAEETGVWVVDGGMHALASAIADRIAAFGGKFRFNTHVSRILTDSAGVTALALENGSTVPADLVVFNGDPRALALGKLGADVASVAPQTRQKKRSLSAHVWAFSATPKGPDLAHHNVFFCSDPRQDFSALEAGALPRDTTLYICAEDRGLPRPPPAVERFEIILNAPPLTDRAHQTGEYETCRTRTFQTLRRFGLTFTPDPPRSALTTPQDFETLFPGSAGSLYGQSPHGMTAALDRPTARTSVTGLYICGGGCHPGAGVPMAALSGKHAAEAILMDRTSTSKSLQTDMLGGMSTASPIAEPARSP